ncbi:hypothetical protein EON65_37010 [archaeon]|nr:MAG: hypothetical protein EON65_37010 [archaeon]
MFAVEPITNCPHVLRLEQEPSDFFPASLDEASQFKGHCRICESSQENWLCLTCRDVYCSRYVNEHMQLHFDAEKHAVAFSLSDGMFGR